MLTALSCFVTLMYFIYVSQCENLIFKIYLVFVVNRRVKSSWSTIVYESRDITVYMPCDYRVKMLYGYNLGEEPW